MLPASASSLWSQPAWLVDELIHFCQDLALLIFSYILGTLKDIESTKSEKMKPNMKSYTGWWKRVVVGVCDLWSEAEPSQNRRKRARRRRTKNRGGKQYVISRGWWIDGWMDGSRYRGKAPYLCISSVFFRFPSISLPPVFLPPATCLLLGMYFPPLHSG